MKKNINFLIILFFSFILFSNILFTQETYQKEFSSTKDDYQLVTFDPLLNNSEVNEIIKKIILDNNYDVEYICSNDNDIFLYNIQNIDSNYHEFISNNNYIKKPFHEYNDSYVNGILFVSSNDANQFKNILVKELNINQDLIQNGLKSFTNEKPTSFLLLLFLTIIILILLFCIVNYYNDNKKNIGNLLLFGFSKSKIFLKLNNSFLITFILSLVIISIFSYIKHLLFLKINLLFIIILFLGFLTFYLIISYKDLRKYLKFYYTIPGLKFLSQCLFSILLIISIFLATFTPIIVSEVNTVSNQYKQAKELQNVYFYKTNLRGENVKYISNPIESAKISKAIYYLNDNNICIGQIELETIDGIKNIVIADNRYAKRYLQEYNVPNDGAIIVNNNSNKYIDDIKDYASIYSANYQLPIINLNEQILKCNMLNPLIIDFSNYQPDAILVVNPKYFDEYGFANTLGEGVNFHQLLLNPAKEEIDKINNYINANNLNSYIVSIPNLYSNYQAQLQERISILIVYSIIFIISVIIFILFLWIFIKLSITDNIKIILMQKLSGFSLIRIYKKIFLYVNALMLISIIIGLVISNWNTYSIILSILIIILINLFVITNIIVNENKKILSLLKEETC